MPGYEKYMYKYEQREKMKTSPLYPKFVEACHNSLVFDSQKVGAVNYLIKEAHLKEFGNDINKILTRQNWARYYLNSGIQRQEKLNEGTKNEYQINRYSGRTLEDLAKVSVLLSNYCKENNMKLSNQAALNILYMEVVDGAYAKYLRTMNTILNLKTKMPDCKFVLLNGLDYENYDVDVMVYKNDNLVTGLKIYPESQKGKIEKKDFKTESQQKHEFFETVYSAPVKLIFASNSGFIKDEIPKL